MIKRRLFQIFPLLLIIALTIQLSVASKCYAEAFAYIPNGDDDTVSVIKVADNSITAEIAVEGESPFGIASGEEYLYVTNEASGTVSVISESYNIVASMLYVGLSPRGIAVTSDETFIYVANYTQNTLSAIDVFSNTREAIDIGAGPLGVAISPSDDFIYVTNSNDDSLSVISAETNDVFVTLKNHYYIYYANDTDDVAFDTPYGVAVSPDGYYIYVVNNGNNTLSVIYAYTIYSEGEDFDWEDYDADDDEEGPYRLYAPIEVGNDPRGVVVTPDQEYLFVTNYDDDTVSVISLDDMEVTETLDVGAGPFGISVTPSGDFVYVVNQLDGTVSVIKTDDDNDYDDISVIETVDIGNNPVGFGSFIGGKPPRKPSNLVADREETNTIKVTWSDNSDDELGFRLMRKRYVGGSYSIIATIDANVTEYIDSGLKNDSNYYYRVCAYNHAGASEYSDADYATTGNDDSGCFIATASYGSLIEPHVKILRDFRDRFLATNRIEKGFLDLYYRYSPPVADFIGQHGTIRFIVCCSLLPFVGISWLYLFIGPISATLTLSGFVILTILSVRTFKRRAANII